MRRLIRNKSAVTVLQGFHGPDIVADPLFPLFLITSLEAKYYSVRFMDDATESCKELAVGASMFEGSQDNPRWILDFRSNVTWQ